MWSKGAGAALPHQRTLQVTVGTIFRWRPWQPPPQLAVSLWLALKTTLHRGRVAAATLPHLISTWIHPLPQPSGAPCLVPSPQILSLWTSPSMLVSFPLTLELRAAQQSWLLPPRLNILALSVEEVISWRGQWPSSVVRGAAAVYRALTLQVGMEVCMARPMPAVIMIQRWRTRTWRKNYRDSGRSKKCTLFTFCLIKVLTWKCFIN